LIITETLLFFVGLFLLYVGAELLVRGSSRIALLMQIPPIVVGLTVVAFGTSSPEFIVSFFAAYSGNIEIAMGNIVGSNIANIGLVLGFSALLRPIAGMGGNVRKEMYWLAVVSVVFWLFAFNGIIGHLEGVLLFAGIIAFTGILIRLSLQNRTLAKQSGVVDDVPDVNTGMEWLDKRSRTQKLVIFGLYTILGIAVLAVGSRITIDAAVTIANILGVPQVIIGLTMVAFGTSLPELATAIISVVKKENEILVGNVIGSNLFNIMAVAGPIAAVFPIPLDEHMKLFDFPLMLLFTFFLIVILVWRRGVERWSAFIMTAGYVAYIAWVAGFLG